MPPKGSSSASAHRRKSGKAVPAIAAPDTTANGAATLMVALKVNPNKLRAILDPSSVKPEPSPSKESPATSTTIAGAPATNGTENPSENASNAGTPAAAGTPAPSQTVPGAPGTPAAEPPKKKGVKRVANGEPRARGKPGPKKKARLEDGSIDPNAPRPSHKLGPKANQGAINAGLRALDRSGKPTRRWTKTTFKLKSFTGEQWELSRWRTNPKPKPEAPKEETATVSTESSNKENKGNASQPNKSDKSPSTADVEMKDAPASAAAGSPVAVPTDTTVPAPPPPAPVPVATAS